MNSDGERAIIRQEEFDPDRMHIETILDGTEVVAFSSVPNTQEIDDHFPIETKGGSRLSARGQLMALTAEGTFIVYPASYVAKMRSEAWGFIRDNMSVNRKHPEMAARHAVLAGLNPRKRRDRRAMRHTWGDLG